MALLHDVEVADLVPGDHIYVWRALYSYSHHGIYMGKTDGVRMVIHFDGSPGEPKSKESARIRRSRLSEFQETNTIRRYEYGASQIECSLKRRGTCCLVESDSAETVLQRARACYDRGLPMDGEYNLLFNNCEHFCLYCKLGPNYKTLQKYDQTQKVLFFW
ncbi:uncharacterized protein LOC144438841 [Glandiceps talaboti]